jgi:hypothetical protein
MEMMSRYAVVDRRRAEHRRRSGNEMAFISYSARVAVDIPENYVAAAIPIEITRAIQMILQPSVADRGWGSKQGARTVQEPQGEIAVIVANRMSLLPLPSKSPALPTRQIVQWRLVRPQENVGLAVTGAVDVKACRHRTDGGDVDSPPDAFVRSGKGALLGLSPKIKERGHQFTYR